MPTVQILAFCVMQLLMKGEHRVAALPLSPLRDEKRQMASILYWIVGALINIWFVYTQFACRGEWCAEWVHTARRGREGRYNEVGRSPNCNNGALHPYVCSFCGANSWRVCCALVYCTSGRCVQCCMCLSLSHTHTGVKKRSVNSIQRASGGTILQAARKRRTAPYMPSWHQTGARAVFAFLCSQRACNKTHHKTPLASSQGQTSSILISRASPWVSALLPAFFFIIS